MKERLDRDVFGGLEALLQLADAGSFAEAARTLRVTPSAISKQIAKLEARFGVRLVQRTTRAMRLTAAGQRAQEGARAVMEALASLEADVQQEHASLRGRVRISAPTLLGQEIVAPICARFAREHPGIEIELALNDRFVDLVAEPFDVAIRVAPRLPISGLTARRLGGMRWILVASEGYLERHGRPRTVDELTSHACLRLSHAGDGDRWKLRVGAEVAIVAVRGPMQSGSLLALRHGALEGLGIALLPAFVVRADVESKRLVHVLPAATTQRSVFLVRAPRASTPRRVRALVDRLVEAMPGALG